MTDTSEPLTMECPFCGWKSKEGEYQMLLHMETLHAEGESPFLTEQDRTSPQNGTGSTAGNDDDPQYVECPVDGCGEFLLVSQVEYHLELHSEETDVQDLPASSEPIPISEPAPSSSITSSAPGPSSKSSHNHPESTRRSKAISAWKRLLRMPSTHREYVLRRRHNSKTTSGSESNTRGTRLGKKHLGKYAHEDRMPDWLADLLRKKGQVQTAGVVPVLAQLLELSPSTNYAYLCHPCVYHISKLKREGGFCGYRNIQMLSSYIIQTGMQNHEKLGPSIPSIFQIQDFIETAWDNGISAAGRIETGGIRGTRKYIGTPEAVAMFRLLQIAFQAQSFKHKEHAKAEEMLMTAVESYFAEDERAVRRGEGGRVRLTGLPPLYFQHYGHSMTIVGVERLRDGGRVLLVFDPHFKDSYAVTGMVGRTVPHPYPDYALRPYRRGNKYLKEFREFEILR
ncbi:peptidase family C78-domain-containing protein [Apiosordaria backusii]|uniref:Peptidase family C78-domain-containing protein n=1 Tax=Apiosordaria backusii TaxID=314023 RepID=A0AA40BRT0_9PEZI|nr:peptidase family C78-domain-containing protein [Apiosordaria backusii]